MELEAKEHRMVILGLQALLRETMEQMKSLSDEEDEYAHLSNDAMLIDTMIQSFQEEYNNRFEHTNT